MFTVWVGPAPVVVLSGFQVVKKALVSHSEKLSGRPLTPLFRDLFGERGKAALPAGNRVAGWGLHVGLQWGDPELLTWRNLPGRTRVSSDNPVRQAGVVWGGTRSGA